MSRENGQTGAYLAGFLVGGLVGATITFLRAPRSGRATREQIRSKGILLRDAAEHTINGALEMIGTMGTELSGRVAEFQAQGQAVIDEAQKRWTTAADGLRDLATEVIEETRKAASGALEPEPVTAETA